MSIPQLDLAGGETAIDRYEARAERLAALEAWSAAGRIAVSTPDDSWSARVSWTQRVQSYRLRLSGPLGQGAAQLMVRPGAVELRTADDRRFTAESASALLQQHVGWDIPLDGLRYWLMGIPDPSEPPSLVDFDEAGLLTRLEQFGWTIRYQGYQPSGDEQMPTRVDFESPRLTGKVVVSRWQMALETAAR